MLTSNARVMRWILLDTPLAVPGDGHLHAGGDDDHRGGREDALLGILVPLEDDKKQQD